MNSSSCTFPTTKTKFQKTQTVKIWRGNNEYRNVQTSHLPFICEVTWVLQITPLTKKRDFTQFSSTTRSQSPRYPLPFVLRPVPQDKGNVGFGNEIGVPPKP